MSRISGFVRSSDGRPASGSTINLRPDYATGGEMGGWGNSGIAPDGSFSFANVPPGQFVLEVTPARDVIVSLGRVTARGAEPPASPEFARMSITVGGNDIAGLVVTTRPGVTVSGRVIFPGNVRPTAPEGAPLRVNAAFQNPEDGPRTMFLRRDNGAIDESGRFQLRDVSGQVLFRVAGSTVDLVTKSVMLNGTDITNTAYDASRGDVSGLEIVMGAPAQINGTAKNTRGEPVRDFRVALFPASAKPSWLTASFMRTGSADPNGRFQFIQLPAGEYLGVAVETFEQGEEWDPAFQQRVLPAARRFTVKEGQTLTIELPYVE